MGIIIGSGLYVNAPLIAQNVSSPAMLLAIWGLGGVFSLLGALCYAELASAFPVDGGNYVYLTRALGRPVGLWFAWSELMIVRPATISMMAFVFLKYLSQITPINETQRLLASVGLIAALTLLNALGVREGSWTQNVVTLGKVVGLACMFLAGLLRGGQDVPADAAGVSDSSSGSLYLAWVLVLFAYSGWHEVAYVSAEVRQGGRNILRALLWGIGTVTVIYLAANGAFLSALGFGGLRNSSDVAADTMHVAFPTAVWTSLAVNGLICISALGSMNGQILTGGRVFYAMGQEHRFFRWLGSWSSSRGTPVVALCVQAAIAMSMLVGFSLPGILSRPSGIDDATQADAFRIFLRMVEFTSPVFWFFMTLAAASLMILRFREPNLARPFRVPGYPVLPLLFIAGCAAVFYSSLVYSINIRSKEALWALTMLIAGLLLLLMDRPVTPLKNPGQA